MDKDMCLFLRMGLRIYSGRSGKYLPFYPQGNVAQKGSTQHTIIGPVFFLIAQLMLYYGVSHTG